MRTLMICGALSVAVLLSVAGCTTKADPEKKTGGDAASVGLPDGLILASAPANAKPLAEVKSGAKKGDTVTFVAKVGGTMNPFVDGRATMVVIDLALASCDDMGDDDHCETPWDYCCESKSDKTANSATVQIVDAKGKLLDLGLKGQSGLNELVTVTVVGVVADKNDEGLMVVNATGLHIEKS